MSAMAKRLYIIDGHAHIYSAYYAPMRQRLSSPAGEPTKAVYIFTNALLKLINEEKPDMLIVAMDSKEPSFRREIYSEYKAHRPPMPDDMPSQIERIEQILSAMNIPVLRQGGYEADDLIGTISTKASEQGIDVFICSKDKDMLQLINEHVKTLDIKTGAVKDLAVMKEEMGMSPEQFLDVLALQGDTSDNIPGVPDVGPKTALQWIQKYGSIDNLYKHADEIKGKRGESLRASRDIVELSRKLVLINRESPVEFDKEKFARKDFDNKALAEIFTELGFSRLLSQLKLSGAEAEATEQKPVAAVGEPANINSRGSEYVLIDSKEKLAEFAKDLKKVKLFAVDTETDSMSAMRAGLVGMSFRWEPKKAYYLAVRGALGAKCLDVKDVREVIGPILADESVKKVGQNIKYDLLVLRNAGMPVKGVHFDTMVASYCLDPLRRSHGMDAMALDFLNYQCVSLTSLIGKGKNQLTFDMVDTEAACRYAAEDADITFALYEYLNERLAKQPGLRKLFEEVEMPLVNVLAEMEYNGVSIDVMLLKKMSSKLENEIKAIAEKIYEEAGTVFNIDSPKQLAEVLFDRLGLESVRVGKAGRSTDAGVLEQLSQEHPIANMVLEYRKLSKLSNTYVDKLGTLINPRTNRVHASFNQTVTATGRLSSSDPNLQNIPIRTELGRAIREAFVPQDKGDYILSADYSQIELRMLAHFSKDEALLKAFAEDKDIHSFVASQIFDVELDDVTSDMRSQCKAVNFGIIYGQGPFGLSRTIGISHAEAKKFIEDYFARYSSIKEFMQNVVKEARQTGYVETILGRQRKILNLNSKNSMKRSQAERLAFNTMLQGSAADLIKVAMINIQRRIESEKLPVKLILQIHDELVFEIPAGNADEQAGWISHEMAGAIKLDVPLKVDVGFGENWLSGK